MDKVADNIAKDLNHIDVLTKRYVYVLSTSTEVCISPIRNRSRFSPVYSFT